MKTAVDIWGRNFEHAERICSNLKSDEALTRSFQLFTEILVKLFNRGGTVFICGNGGSHCDAMHFAEELTGRFHRNRKPLGALALGDPSHLTCVSNDFGFEHVFERQVQALGRTGDVLVGISTGGNSKNVARTIEAAKAKGLKTIGLLGNDGGPIKGLVDISIIVREAKAERVQEAHIKIIHTLIEAIKDALFNTPPIESGRGSSLEDA